VPFNEFQETFFDKVSSIGRVISLLAPFERPANLDRLWCNFELNACTKLRESMGVELYVVLPDAEWVKLQGRLVEALRKSIMKGPSNVWKALADVHIERARATYPDDRDNILQVLAPGINATDTLALEKACLPVNVSIVKELTIWFSRMVQKRRSSMSVEAIFAASDMLMSFGADYYDVAFEMTSQAGGVLRTALDAVLRALNSSNTRSTSSDEIDQLFEDMDSVLAGDSAAAPTSLPASARAPPSSDASNNPVVHQLNFKLAAMHWRQGQIRRRQKRPDDALDCYHKAEALFVASSGETSPEFASCMGGVGIIYRDSKKQSEEGLRYFGRMEEAYIRLQDDQSLDYATSIKHYGACFIEAKRFAEGMQKFETARAIYKASGNDNTVWSADVLSRMGYVRQCEGRAAEAIELFAQAYRTLRHIDPDMKTPQFEYLMKEPCYYEPPDGDLHSPDRPLGQPLGPYMSSAPTPASTKGLP